MGTKLGLGAAQDIHDHATHKRNHAEEDHISRRDARSQQSFETGEELTSIVPASGTGSRPVAMKMELTAFSAHAISASTVQPEFPGQGLTSPMGFIFRTSRPGKSQVQWRSEPRHSRVGVGDGPDRDAIDLVIYTQLHARFPRERLLPEGMFLQTAQSGEIDQYSGGQRHWVSSLGEHSRPA